MIDHITFYVRDLETSKTFYEQCLKPLGMKINFGSAEDGFYGFGEQENPEFEISQSSNFFIAEENKQQSKHIHVAFACGSKDMVEQFHEAGLAAGGTDNGAPGIRQEYAKNYYAAFILDPDGNNIECVTYI